jgi:hypothetical protein
MRFNSRTLILPFEPSFFCRPYRFEAMSPHDPARLARIGEATKLALVRASRRGSEHIADSDDPKRIVKDHQALRSFAAVASVCLGWQSDSPGATFNLNVLNLGNADIDVKPCPNRQAGVN